MEVGVRDDNIIVISPITGTPAFNIECILVMK